MADEKILLTGQAIDGETGVEGGPPRVRVSTVPPTGEDATEIQNAEGIDLEVINPQQRRLTEMLFLQGRDAALLAPKIRSREKITLTDRRGRDSRRGR